MQHSLDLETLSTGYASGAYTPLGVIDMIAAHFARTSSQGVFIVETFAQARADAQAVMARRARGEALPLYGIPFAVKDNIDVAGMNTSAACPAFAYRAERSAAVVEHLVAAGAIMVGKTNLDQFA